MAKRKEDRRCYYCRRKATTTEDAHPSCGRHATALAAAKGPKVQPVVRPMLRNGRGSFLRALRGKIANVKADAYETAYRGRVLDVVDVAIARYTGE